MADLPQPISFPQALGLIHDSFVSRAGIRQVKVGDPLLSLFEAAAQHDVKTSGDLFRALLSNDPRNLRGADLDSYGASRGVRRRRASRTVGRITVSDTSFTKIATRVSGAASAPIVGTTTLRVEDASGFPTTGSVYAGNGTPRIEGPLAYTARTDVGSHWTISLSAPTTRFHNWGEPVVLAQGGTRAIGVGQIVGTPIGALSVQQQYTTLFGATIPDGETSVDGVEVVATTPGRAGRAPAGTVTAFPGGEPFTGAAVTNPRDFSSGDDAESDEDYLERIIAVEASRARATDLALQTAVLGATAADERKVASSVTVSHRLDTATLVVDDGSGYEEVPAGVGLETLTDSASGGEQDFRLIHWPVTKGFVEAENSAPYGLRDGAKLRVRVGSVVSEHAFDESEFAAITAASAYEVAAAVNADPNAGFSVRTVAGGTRLAIYGRSEVDDDIEVVIVDEPDVDAAPVLGLPVGIGSTLALFLNDQPLSKDGRSAVVLSNGFGTWPAFVGSQTLTLAVDGTPEATYTFTDADFVDAGTAYGGVGRNSTEAWAAVINLKVPGVTAAVATSAVSLASNLGRSSRASVEVTGGTLVALGVFAPAQAQGVDHDYDLDRGSGRIALEAVLAPGDRLTAGTRETRAFLETPSIAATTFATDGTLWLAVDAEPVVIPHGVGGATDLNTSVVATTDYGYRVEVSAEEATFDDARRGDWAVVYDPGADPVLAGARRVVDAPDPFVVVSVTPAGPSISADVDSVVPVVFTFSHDVDPASVILNTSVTQFITAGVKNSNDHPSTVWKGTATVSGKQIILTPTGNWGKIDGGSFGLCATLYTITFTVNRGVKRLSDGIYVQNANFSSPAYDVDDSSGC